MSIYRHIRPGGITQGWLVDLLYQIGAALQGLCTKLDADGGVPLTTYVANVCTAIFSGALSDSQGNTNRLFLNAKQFQEFTVNGVSQHGLISFLYQILKALETLCAQLDTDTLTDSDYESGVFQAIVTYRVMDLEGNTAGYGTTYLLHPGGISDNHLLDLLYQIVNVIKTVAAKLDADGTVTDTDYEALWYTAVLTVKIENTSGKVLGNC